MFDLSILGTQPYKEWLLQGILTTIKLAILGAAGGTVLGVLLVTMRMSGVNILALVARAYVYFFRNTPFPVQVLFWFFGFPFLLPVAWQQFMYQFSYEFFAGTTALVAYTGAYIAEHLRSGLASIPKSQMESALSSGFSVLQSLWYVIFPQAFRIALPPLISEYLTVAKNSSVTMTIGVMEAVSMARQIEAYTFRTFEAYAAVSLFYLTLSLLTSRVLNWYDRRYLRPHVT